MPRSIRLRCYACGASPGSAEEALVDGIGLPVDPGLIYAGQAGAGKSYAKPGAGSVETTWA